MNTLSLQEASTKLPHIIAETIQNNDETLIVSDYDTEEALALLRDNKSLDALLEEHRKRDQGIIPPGKKISEVFKIEER